MLKKQITRRYADKSTVDIPSNHTHIGHGDKVGAGARLSVEYVKNAEPDGSVMLFTPEFPMTVYPHIYRSLGYDPLRDFTAVAPTTSSMLTYVIGPAVPPDVKSLPDFLQWCKANPAKA